MDRENDESNDRGERLEKQRHKKVKSKLSLNRLKGKPWTKVNLKWSINDPNDPPFSYYLEDTLVSSSGSDTFYPRDSMNFDLFTSGEYIKAKQATAKFTVDKSGFEEVGLASFRIASGVVKTKLEEKLAEILDNGKIKVSGLQIEPEGQFAIGVKINGSVEIPSFFDVKFEISAVARFGKYKESVARRILDRNRVVPAHEKMNINVKIDKEQFDLTLRLEWYVEALSIFASVPLLGLPLAVYGSAKITAEKILEAIARAYVLPKLQAIIDDSAKSYLSQTLANYPNMELYDIDYFPGHDGAYGGGPLLDIRLQLSPEPIETVRDSALVDLPLGFERLR